MVLSSSWLDKLSSSGVMCGLCGCTNLPNSPIRKWGCPSRISSWYLSGQFQKKGLDPLTHSYHVSMYPELLQQQGPAVISLLIPSTATTINLVPPSLAFSSWCFLLYRCKMLYPFFPLDHLYCRTDRPSCKLEQADTTRPSVGPNTNKFKFFQDTYV